MEVSGSAFIPPPPLGRQDGEGATLGVLFFFFRFVSGESRSESPVRQKSRPVNEWIAAHTKSSDSCLSQLTLSEMNLC
ncbi:hypothetical protein TNCV_1524541 [Trichonephila clavipes]|nr:hypothetical protein TNCV_1524541 [Trichonephila clavipes]